MSVTGSDDDDPSTHRRLFPVRADGARSRSWSLTGLNYHIDWLRTTGNEFSTLIIPPQCRSYINHLPRHKVSKERA